MPRPEVYASSKPVLAGAVYARISDDAEGRAIGVARQVQDATRLAERLGWTLGHEPFIDNDISASTRSSAKRPAYDRMKRNLFHVTEWVSTVRLEEAWPVAPEVPQDDGGEALSVELGEVEQDIAELQDTLKSGGIRFADYNMALAALRTREEAITHALRQRASEQPPDPSEVDFKAMWRSGDVEAKRKVLAWAVDHIVIHPVGMVGPVRARAMVPETVIVVPRA